MIQVYFLMKKMIQLNIEFKLWIWIRLSSIISRVNKNLNVSLKILFSVNSKTGIITWGLESGKTIFENFSNNINFVNTIQNTDNPVNIQISKAKYKLIEESQKFKIQKKEKIFKKEKIILLII
jgi:hypothetical protein